jgi:hypothetical protein
VDSVSRETIKCKPVFDHVINRICCVVGDGGSAVEDLLVFRAYNVPAEYVAVNLAGRLLEHLGIRVDHWATLEPQFFAAESRRLGDALAKHTGEDLVETGFDFYWSKRPPGWDGTGGLFAAKIALAMGFERIVLCGIPMDDSGHWYSKNDDTRGLEIFIQPWVDFATRLDVINRVRSLSGRTRQLLGAPTREFLTLPDVNRVKHA